jgi:Zn-finger nucleic acid-binding protein
MQCPKCNGDLETKEHEHIKVQRCSNCYGLFFEPYMLTETFAAWMAESFLDVGAASLGRKYDKIDDIDCPNCNVAMDKIEDPVQTHIWMEACPSCERVFLDAGELTDLKYETFSDKIKSLLKGKRKHTEA